MTNETILTVMPVLASYSSTKDGKKAGTKDRNRKEKREKKQFGWQLGEGAYFQKEDSFAKYTTYGRNLKTM